jgi:hypothetical protein
MAHEYSSKLTLKDNFSAVIQKAIAATEALRNKLQATEKDLNKLGKKKIKIGAELDSSVNSSLNKLNDKIPKDRIIKIKAKDEVTRNIINMQRDIYKMGREISVGMKDPFKGLSRSTVRATGNITAMQIATQNLARTMAVSHAASAAAGASMAASAAAGAAAGRMARTKSAGRSMIYAGRLSKNSPDPDYYESKEQFHRLGRGDIPARFNKLSRSLTYFDADRADMIARQQRTMRDRFSVKRYLPNYRADDEHIGGGDYLRVLHKRLGRAGYAYHSAKETVQLKLDLVTTAAERKLKSFANKIKNSKATEIAMRVKFAGERAAYSMSGIGDLFKNKVVSIATKFKDNGAVKGIESLYSKAKSLAGKTFAFTVKANTANAQKALDGLKSAAKGITIATGAGVLAGATKAITGAASLETNSIAINHFVKYNNQKQFSEGKAAKMSDAEIAAASDAYMDKMRKYAAATPFSDIDVMDAGRRAVNIMQGDLAGAEELTKIAGDMAALNPGKTIMQAMEALADLKPGEMERMKEFGLKISAKQYKGLVGKGENDDLTDEEQAKAYKILMDQKLKTMFGGGAAKLSQSATGKFSTLTGTITSGLADVGTMFLPGIKDGLDKLTKMFEETAPKIKAVLAPVATAFNALMKTDFGPKLVIAGAAVAAIAVAFTALGAAISLVAVPLSLAVKGFGMLLSAFKLVSTVISVVRTAMLGLNLAMLANPVTLVIAGIAALIAIGYVLYKNWDKIKAFFENLWEGAKAAAVSFGEWISQCFDTAGAFVTQVWNNVSQFMQDMWVGPSAAIDGFINGIRSGFGSAVDWVKEKWQALCDFFTLNVPNPSFSFGGNISSSDEGSERAVGMEYIPYNGYKISAHRGEAILTRTEADQWRAGRSRSAGSVVINIHDPVVREESDLDRLGTIFAQKLSEVRSNMGAVPA